MSEQIKLLEEMKEKQIKRNEFTGERKRKKQRNEEEESVFSTNILILILASQFVV